MVAGLPPGSELGLLLPPDPDRGLGHPAAIASLLVQLALGALAIAGLRRRSLYSFGILLYLLMLAPVSNQFFPIGATIAERC